MDVGWPRIGLRGCASMLGLGVIFTAIGGGALTRALEITGLEVYIAYATGAAALVGGLPIVQMAVLNAPPLRTRPGGFLLVHLLGYALYTALAVAVMRALRALALPWFALDPTLPSVWAQLLIELPNVATTYAAAAALLSALLATEARRHAAQRASELSAQLARARMAALRARLDPEPVLQALDDLKVMMRVDLPASERAIQRLASTLRAALSRDEPELPLEHDEPLTAAALPRHVHAARLLALRVPQLHAREALLLLIGVQLFFLLHASTVDSIPYGGRAAVYLWFVASGLGLWLAIAVVVLTVANTQHAPLVVALPIHIVALLSFSLVHVGSARALRSLVAALSGIVVTATSFTFDMQLDAGKDMGLYIGLSALCIAFYAGVERANDSRRAADMDATLSGLQLELLSARLEPHFMYNALNTVSSLMYEDVERTEHLLESLKQLLRATLIHSSAVWAIAEEAELTSRYIDLLEARFGDQISVSWHLPRELSHTRVPRFALQILVENAVKHNQTRRQPLQIDIRGEQRAAEVFLTVSDNGCGFGGVSPNPHGRGLSLLSDVIRLQYGVRARLSQTGSQPGGAQVELAIPACS